MTDREDAWDAVHEALLAGWTVGPPTYDFGVRGWSVTARSVAHVNAVVPASTFLQAKVARVNGAISRDSAVY